VRRGGIVGAKPTGYGIMTWFCVSKIFGPVGPEKRSYAIDPHLRSDQVGAAIGRPKSCGLQKQPGMCMPEGSG